MNIEPIITGILKREGWNLYTDHPADKGGPTKWGITQQSWSSYIGRPATPDDVRSIDEQQARKFYTEVYVTRPSFDKIADADLCELVIDCGVNHGVGTAATWLQAAAGTRPDGEVGPLTLAALAGKDPVSVYLRICAYRTRLYGRLVTNNHSQAVFAAGWNNRVAEFISKAADRLA